MKSFAARLVLVASAASFMAVGPASAAVKTQTAAYSPWAALSAFAAPASSQALCGAAAASAASTVASSAAQPASGCVFPQVDAPVVAPAPEAAPVVAVAGTPAIGILPLLLGLAAIGGAAALLLGGDDDQGAQISVSP